MPDDLNIKRPQDPNTVNTTQEWEIKYWCDKFGVSKEALLAAVKAVGNQVVKVKDWLKKNGYL